MLDCMQPLHPLCLTFLGGGVGCFSDVILHSYGRQDQNRKSQSGNSLVVQWLGRCALTAEGPGSVPGRGTKISQAVWPSKKKKERKKKPVPWLPERPLVLGL